jgi:hypothetical protein
MWSIVFSSLKVFNYLVFYLNFPLKLILTQCKHLVRLWYFLLNISQIPLILIYFQIIHTCLFGFTTKQGFTPYYICVFLFDRINVLLVIYLQGGSPKGRKTASKEAINVTGEAVIVPCASPNHNSRPSTSATSSNFQISSSSYESSNSGTGKDCPSLYCNLVLKQV